MIQPKQISVLPTPLIRELDRYAIESLQIPGGLLMENAGRSLTESFARHALSGPFFSLPQVVILAGPGNNGGDGFVMARRLQLLGVPVKVAAIGSPDRWKGEAKVNLQILQKIADSHLSLYFAEPEKKDRLEKVKGMIEKSDWVIDALLGTGASGVPRSPIKEIIAMVNQSSKKVFAVDLPSGLDSELGSPFDFEIGAIHAQVTCTLAAVKKGFLEPNLPRLPISVF